MKNIFQLVLIILFPLIAFSQQTILKAIKGKIVASYGSVEGIHIINTKTELVVLADENGFFDIPVCVGDTLMFSSVQYKAKRLLIGENEIEKALNFIKMEPIMNQLNEVMVFQYKHINAVAMGIIPKGQKTFTPAERKINTASNPYITGNIDGTVGGSIGLDPLFNALSGRTAMLKKVVEVEKKEFSRAKTTDYFEENYFVEKLLIPKEFVKGFQFFIVENESYSKAIQGKNKTLAKFIMGELAVKYIDLIKGN